MTIRRLPRSAMWLAGIAATLPLALLAGVGRAAPAAADPQFAPPKGDLTLTRTLRRTLGDGKQVITSRIYQIRISTEGSGYRIDGQQIDCMVDAPPMLEFLAAIEKSRVDDGMFPIMLNAQGTITALGSEPHSDSINRAASLAQGMINQSGLASDGQAMAGGFVKQLQGDTSSLSAWPLDLFIAKPGKRSETRSVALPDGSEGVVTISEEARQTGAADYTRYASQVERVVVTDLGGAQRITHEEWTLGAP